MDVYSPPGVAIVQISLRIESQRALPVALQKIQATVKSSLNQLGHARFLIEHHTQHLLDLLVGNLEVAHLSLIHI